MAIHYAHTSCTTIMVEMSKPAQRNYDKDCKRAIKVHAEEEEKRRKKSLAKLKG